jgi:hypothetical protein
VAAVGQWSNGVLRLDGRSRVAVAREESWRRSFWASFCRGWGECPAKQKDDGGISSNSSTKLWIFFFAQAKLRGLSI